MVRNKCSAYKPWQDKISGCWLSTAYWEASSYFIIFIRQNYQTISPVPFAKDLGVYIDQYLTCDVHITETASNCMNQLVHRRIQHLLDKKTLLLLINSFVFSKLFYCSSVWGNTSKRNLHKLQLVQNFAARVVLGLRKFDHISQGRR